MEIRQRTELRRLLIPELNQSLKVLSLPLQDLNTLVQDELLNNPFLEEARRAPSFSSQNSKAKNGLDYRVNLITKKDTLQDILLRQLGMFANTDEEFKIGQEIIGNIDENGYLNTTSEQIASTLGVKLEEIEKVLKLIQQFEPAGVAARTISECLLNQLDFANLKEPLLRKIVENHLEDVAKKNYSRIAKGLNRPLEKIQPLIKIILKLDPKPGRNYSPEEIQRVVPDITIYDKDEEFEIAINDEDLPTVNINNAYKEMLKNKALDPKTKEFLSEKFQNALALLRAISRRKVTLRKIAETIAGIQQAAIRHDLSFLKPLTFGEIAQKINMHETTVCRAVMNKYVRLPYGVVALKDFFSSQLKDQNGSSFSSTHVKRLIKDLVEQENKKKPLSDQEIAKKLAEEKGIKISRRTIAKYREEMKILSTSFRREK
jgi:RNA polymerase sigma-54 factor